MELLLIIVLIAGILSIVMALFFAKMVMKEDPGNEKMVEVSGYIEAGAKTFINVQYKVLAVFVGVLAVLLLFFMNPGTLSVPHMIAYIVGALGSMWAGWLGMIGRRDQRAG